MTTILIATTVGGWGLALILACRLYRWETVLSRSRVKVYFKGRTKMTPRLIDWVRWAAQLQGDKAVNGQVIYKQGGTTIAITKAHAYVRKPRSKTVKENSTAWHKKAVSRLTSRSRNDAHSTRSPAKKA